MPLVQLDPDHPGFRDPEYRTRRNAIAGMALDYQAGTPIPDALYTREEHLLWKSIREHWNRPSNNTPARNISTALRN